MSDYWIRQDVHLCIADGCAIWLDLKRDKYFGLTGAQTRVLSALMHTWLSGEIPERQKFAPTDYQAEKLAEALVGRQLLTRDRTLGKTPTPHQYRLATRGLFEDVNSVRPAIGWRHLSRFIAAYLLGLITLRFSSLSHAIKYLQETKSRKAKSMHESVWTDSTTELTRELVSVFERLRIFFYTSKAACLFDSIVLMHFLAAYNIHPVFMVGVSVRPFKAHCWVQQGDAVFNGNSTFAQRFTPILSI